MTETPPNILRDQVYEDMRHALMMGHYMPGQKLVIRHLAESFGTSLTPIRETLRRLVAEGVLDGEAKRSVRIPRMTGAKIRELRDIRLAVEILAVSRAAERIEPGEVTKLRAIATELRDIRIRGDIEADIAKVREFQFSLYRVSQMPNLVCIIESLWLQTGPYLKLFYPNFIKSVSERRGDWREQLCDALEKHDVVEARKVVEVDLREATDYLISLIDAADIIAQ